MPAPALELRALHKRFGRSVVLHELSLTVERGQVFGLLGPNGSGKTTTLACALGLMRPTSGSARILGEPAPRIHRTRGKVGVVFDRAVLLPGLSVRQNLEYVRRLQGTRGGRGIDEVLELVGLDRHRGARAATLSLGQAKRLAIAGALLGEPELLICDEPLSGLDTLGTRAVLRLFARLASEGLTLVLSSHRLPEMQTLVTHAAILLHGRVARAGTLAEMLERGRELHELVAEPRERALEAVRALSGARVVESDRERIRVELDGLAPAALNAALVRAGCAVSRLVRVERDLQGLFESLVDAAGAGEELG